MKLKASLKIKFYKPNKIAIIMLPMIEDRHLVKRKEGREKGREEKGNQCLSLWQARWMKRFKAVILGFKEQECNGTSESHFLIYY